MDEPELARRIISQCPQLVFPAWIPVLKEKCSGRLQVSKFGGCRPYRWKYFQWPRCSQCNKPKSFLLQIQVKTLPSLFGTILGLQSGLIQVFQCLDLDCSTRRKSSCFEDILVIPEHELVPSLQTLCSFTLVEEGMELKTLPRKLRQLVEDCTESYQTGIGLNRLKETEVESWQFYAKEFMS